MPHVPTTAPEAATLLPLLDEQRALVLWKLEGLTDELARRCIVDSGLSVLSVVKHLAWMERSYFGDDIGDQDIAFPWSAAEPDGDWRLEPDDDLDRITNFYVDAVAESRAIVADLDLDFVAGSAERPLSLRFVVAQMIAETARHLGHIDIIREQLDGTTGYVPAG